MTTVHYGYPDPEAEMAANEKPPVEILSELPPGQTLRGRVEAILFLTGKALSLAEIAEQAGTPYEDTENALMALMDDYRFREDAAALEIDDTDGYILQVKEEYGDIVRRMMPLEISAAELRTLSAIAIKAPVLQSELIEWRGAAAYEHIAGLLKRKLITKRREGRSYLLNVTRQFHEHFKLTADRKDLAYLLPLIGKEGGKSADAPEIPPHEGNYEDARFDAAGNPLI